MSPSSRSEMALASEDLRLGHLHIHGGDDVVGSPDNVVGRKKKRGQRVVGGDKSRGLRQFSMKVCEKVESKGITTYNEVADELVAEYSDPTDNLSPSDQPGDDQKNIQPGDDQKNIRRRVYDALNVLMAMDIISKEKKEIQWRGLPHTNLNDIEDLKAEHVSRRNRIDKKAAYLQELEEQKNLDFLLHPVLGPGLENLIERNEQLYGSGNAPTGGVALPFILVQTRPHATVEVEISEDMQLVHFDFNSAPFELHDDNYVLKAMRFCERPQSDDGTRNSTANGSETPSMLDMHQSHVSRPLTSNAAGRAPSSPPLPGILKARVKPERMCHA
ncbi:hypothetical protein IFM89_028934 [Coptis chinensis]|uniref:Transcription factor-like protein DPB n=1 Tax=Coptis chinensis TaxID=261450 RepID=A0A835LJ24_9MAGN|nr:hypothetical protein IFM89_028934 [Coptis chinensis]